jgi:DUF4097 and DUF4098 domain-containing protein YvlB
MRSKRVFALIGASVIGLLLIARGCSGSKENAATKVETAVITVVDDKSQPVEFSISAKDDEGVDLPEREEIRQMYRLTPEATAWVSNMNGKVKVDSTDGDIAEILVVHSARRREDLQYSQIKIHQGHGRDEKTLYIDRKSVSSSPDAIPESRQRVILKLPHMTNLEIHEIDGDVSVDQIHGRVEVMRVGGPVRIARAAGQIKLGEINGGVDVAFAPLSGNEAKNRDVNLHRVIHKGPEALLPGNLISVRSVNGDVDLRFEGELNADVNAWSVTGNIEPDLPNVERLPAEPPVGRLKARIGGGGASIEIQNVNGNLKLSKAGSKDASSVR